MTIEIKGEPKEIADFVTGITKSAEEKSVELTVINNSTNND